MWIHRSRRTTLHFRSVMRLAGLQDPVLVQLYTALAIDPNHSYAHNQLGVVYFERKEHEKAEAAFRRAVEY